MSTQAELNLSPYQYILYYCGADQKDSAVYQTDCSDVALCSYDISSNLQIDSWLLTGYSAPSMAHLMTFAWANVHAWYRGYYEVPAEIDTYQRYKISGAELALVRTEASMIGYIVYDTTAQRQKYWSGSAWVSQW